MFKNVVEQVKIEERKKDRICFDSSNNGMNNFGKKYNSENKIKLLALFNGMSLHIVLL